MSWQLPPSADNPLERFFQFLERNAGQHGTPVLPSPFDDLMVHCAVRRDEQHNVVPLIIDGAKAAQFALKNTQAVNGNPLAFRAAAASENFDVLVCYDPSDIQVAQLEIPVAQQPLKPLLAYAAINDLGIMFFSHRRMFQLSSATIQSLLGIEHPRTGTREIEATGDMAFADSTLTAQQQEVFLEVLEHEKWLEPSSIEFVTVVMPDGNEYDCATFRLMPGIDTNMWQDHTRKIGEAFTEITGRPFALIPYEGLSLERGGFN